MTTKERNGFGLAAVFVVSGLFVVPGWAQSVIPPYAQVGPGSGPQPPIHITVQTGNSSSLPSGTGWGGLLIDFQGTDSDGDLGGGRLSIPSAVFGDVGTMTIQFGPLGTGLQRSDIAHVGIINSGVEPPETIGDLSLVIDAQNTDVGANSDIDLSIVFYNLYHVNQDSVSVPTGAVFLHPAQGWLTLTVPRHLSASDIFALPIGVIDVDVSHVPESLSITIWGLGVLFVSLAIWSSRRRTG